jgi:hypothetical protein
LSACAVQSICDYLVDPNGTIEINNNATGCNSPEEVQDSCEAHAGYIDPEIITDDISMFPNPAHQEFNITVEGYIIDEVSIYTLTGQQVYRIRPKDKTIDISGLPSGMYIVEVMVEGRKVRRKLLVQ